MMRHVKVGLELRGEDVKKDRTYDAATWEPIFAEFGPRRAAADCAVQVVYV